MELSFLIEKKAFVKRPAGRQRGGHVCARPTCLRCALACLPAVMLLTLKFPPAGARAFRAPRRLPLCPAASAVTH